MNERIKHFVRWTMCYGTLTTIWIGSFIALWCVTAWHMCYMYSMHGVSQDILDWQHRIVICTRWVPPLLIVLRRILVLRYHIASYCIVLYRTVRGAKHLLSIHSHVFWEIDGLPYDRNRAPHPTPTCNVPLGDQLPWEEDSTCTIPSKNLCLYMLHRWPMPSDAWLEHQYRPRRSTSTTRLRRR